MRAAPVSARLFFWLKRGSRPAPPAGASPCTHRRTKMRPQRPVKSLGAKTRSGRFRAHRRSHVPVALPEAERKRSRGKLKMARAPHLNSSSFAIELSRTISPDFSLRFPAFSRRFRADLYSALRRAYCNSGLMLGRRLSHRSRPNFRRVFCLGASRQIQKEGFYAH